MSSNDEKTSNEGPAAGHFEKVTTSGDVVLGALRPQTFRPLGLQVVAHCTAFTHRASTPSLPAVFEFHLLCQQVEVELELWLSYRADLL
jgi:hypothetical protein